MLTVDLSAGSRFDTSAYRENRVRGLLCARCSGRVVLLFLVKQGAFACFVSKKKKKKPSQGNCKKSYNTPVGDSRHEESGCADDSAFPNIMIRRRPGYIRVTPIPGTQAHARKVCGMIRIFLRQEYTIVFILSTLYNIDRRHRSLICTIALVCMGGNIQVRHCTQN